MDSSTAATGSMSALDTASITGMFEVHLITTPQFEPQLFGFVANVSKNPALIRPRPTCARSLYGSCPVQPMLTFWAKGTYPQVRELVSGVEKQMLDAGMSIVRTKIESMANNDGVPDRCVEQHYFEFHWKVPVRDTKEWNTLVKLLTPHAVHLFFNPYNKSLTPVATLRCYTSRTDLEASFAAVQKLQRDNGFEPTDPEKEFSVFDSNVNLDKGWLFAESPTKFITEPAAQMIFSL